MLPCFPGESSFWFLLKKAQLTEKSYIRREKLTMTRKSYNWREQQSRVATDFKNGTEREPASYRSQPDPCFPALQLQLSVKLGRRERERERERTAVAKHKKERKKQTNKQTTWGKKKRMELRTMSVWCAED